jgi:hypothetical protein
LGKDVFDAEEHIEEAESEKGGASAEDCHHLTQPARGNQAQEGAACKSGFLI